MPSRLSIQTDSSSFSASYDVHTSPTSPPFKKQKMSVTQVYRLAHTARGKLSSEASRAEYDLRVLVGHANLLDNLMIDLSNAEKEQEELYHSTSRPTTITFAEQTVELPEDSDSDSDDDEEEMDEDKDFSDVEEDEEEEQVASLAQRTSSRPSLVVMAEDLVEESEYDEDWDEPELSLMRTQSRSEQPQEHEHGVPELLHDSDDSDSDDDLSPQPTSYSTYHQVTIKDFATPAEETLHDEGFWIPDRQPALIAAAC